MKEEHFLSVTELSQKHGFNSQMFPEGVDGRGSFLHQCLVPELFTETYKISVFHCFSANCMHQQ